MKYRYTFKLQALEPADARRVPDRVDYIFSARDHETAALKAVEHAAQYSEQHKCIVTDIILKERIVL